MAETKKKQPSNKKTAHRSQSNSTEKKGTNTQRKTNNSKSAKNAKKNYDSSVANKQIICYALFAVALFLLCIVIIPSGVAAGETNAWQALKDAFFGVFGLGACVIPFVLGYVAISVSNEKPVSGIVARVTGLVASMLGICSFMHLLINSAEYLKNTPLSEQIKAAWDNGFNFLNPGFFGSLLGGSIAGLFGKAAAIVTLIIIVFIVIMLLTGTSLGAFIRFITWPFIKLFDSISYRIAMAGENKEKPKRIKREKSEKSRTSYRTPTSEEVFSDEESEVTDKHSRKKRKTEEFVPPAPVDMTDTFSENSNPADDGEIDVPVFSPMPIPSFGEMPAYDPDTAQQVETVEPDFVPGDEIPSKSVMPAEDVIDLINKAGDENAAASQSVIDIADDEDDGDGMEAAPEHVYVLPDVECLARANSAGDDDIKDELAANANKLVETLRSFNIETRIVDIARGPSVTRYEIQPAPGIKISRIANLADDIAMNLAASGVRIEAPIPNKAAVGIEIPNRTRLTVSLREIIDSPQFKSATSKLNVALGKDISGNVTCTDLAKMPHLLIAGTTGSGKSVCLNAMIISILFNSTPDEVKLIMIDPKQVEFTIYRDIPHLMVPVVSDPRKAAGALAWAVSEMTKRYKMFSEKGVRDIKGYNKMAANDPEMTPMYQIVIFIDELSDLMMVAQNEVEDSICRLAQMARAAGMHLVIATQRPSVNVITGIIKANIPSRIALFVSSQVDSRTIIDTAGAEKLLGNGDMLFSPVGLSKPVRLQGCYVSDEEVERVVDFIKTQGECEYDSDVMEEIEKQAVAEKKKEGYHVDADASPDSGADEETLRAIAVVVEHQMASTTLLQRKLKIGYAKAARIMDELEEKGVIGPFEGSKPRKVLMSKQQYNEMMALGGGFVGLGDSSDSTEE